MLNKGTGPLRKRFGIVYVTDTGYINRSYLAKMKAKDIYLIESNHDEKMLMEGPYPYYLKQRVISDRGHLSNKTTAKYLENLVQAPWHKPNKLV